MSCDCCHQGPLTAPVQLTVIGIRHHPLPGCIKAAVRPRLASGLYDDLLTVLWLVTAVGIIFIDLYRISVPHWRGRTGNKERRHSLLCEEHVTRPDALRKGSVSPVVVAREAFRHSVEYSDNRGHHFMLLNLAPAVTFHLAPLGFLALVVPSLSQPCASFQRRPPTTCRRPAVTE